MKRFLSLSLIAVIIMTVIAGSVVFAADVMDEQTGESVVYRSHFCNALNKFITENGLKSQYTFADTGEMFTEDNIENAVKDGLIKIYSETDSYVVFNIRGIEEKETTEYVRGYKFTNDRRFSVTNPTGSCVYSEGYLLGIKDAVKMALIKAEELAEIIPGATKAEDLGKVAYTKDFCDALNKYVTDNGVVNYYISENPDEPFTPDNMDKWLNNYTINIYSENEQYTAFEIHGVMSSVGTEIIGDYKFLNNMSFSGNNQTGYCIYKDGVVYSIKEGVENCFADVEALAEVFPFTTLIEKPEETTQPISETVTTEATTTEPVNSTAPVTNPPIKKEPVISQKSLHINSGVWKNLTVKNATVKVWKTSNKKVASVSKGRVTALDKGKAVITAVLANGKRLQCSVKVLSAPKLSKKSIKVNKKGVASVKLIGKAPIKSKFVNTKYAKVISKENANVLKIKGLKKGSTYIKIKVNGVKVLKLQVTVK